MPKNFQEWLSEGEQLYNAALAEFQAIESQLDELEQKLTAKQAEVNQIAQVIGKPPVENNRRLTAQLVSETDRPANASGGHTNASAPSVIARALTGNRFQR